MVSWHEFCFLSSEKHFHTFKEIIPNIEMRHSSVLPTEMLAFCAVARELGITRVIESGRKFGYSTDIIASFGFPEFYSIDFDPLPLWDTKLYHHKNLRLKSGNSVRFLKQHQDLQNGSAMLLDGPKGNEAISLLDAASNRCVISAIHDLSPNVPYRAKMATRGAFFTDDPEFLDCFGEIDHEILKFRGYAHHGQLLCEANVLGIVGSTAACLRIAELHNGE